MLFIFMNGQVAHPPAVEQPSPPATPGTTGSSLSPVMASASLATGKMISTVIFGWAASVGRRSWTIAVTIPASVPRIKRRRCSFAAAPASATFSRM